MSILDNFPKPSAFKTIEIETLDFIRSDKLFAEYFPNIMIDSERVYHFFKNRQDRFLLNYETYFDSSIAGIRIYLGGVITTNPNDQDKYDQFSYYLLVCDNSNEDVRVLRKFHFDLAYPGIHRRNMHPIFHLQYAGKLTPGLEKRGFNYDHIKPLFPDFSKPRIPHMPISLALLIDFAIKEFGEYENCNRIILLPEWRRIIKKNEQLLFTPFIKNCFSFINDCESSNRNISDYFYGN